MAARPLRGLLAAILARGAAGLLARGAGEELEAAEDFHMPKSTQRLRDIFARERREEHKNFERSAKRGRAKMAVGVFSVLKESDVRQVLRETWMSHPDVCSISEPIDNCTLRVAFVVGRDASSRQGPRTLTREGLSWLAEEPDVLVLDIPENMDDGKSFAWLQLAAERLGWADYVAKMDQDVYLHASAVIEALPLDTECEAYLGKPWTCLTKGVCPPRWCGPPLGHEFRRFREAEPGRGCWTYMQGGFYALSRGLLANITTPGGFFDRHRRGFEDLQTGSAVNRYAEMPDSKCVYIWDDENVKFDRIYRHLRGRNEHPFKVNPSWDVYYGWRVNGGRKGYPEWMSARAASGARVEKS